MTHTSLYIPPHKRRKFEETPSSEISTLDTVKENTFDEKYQRESFEKLSNDIQGLVNKASSSNVVEVVKELFRLNLIRGRGLLCKMIIKAQQGHGSLFTPVYAALISVVNTKFPDIGELLIHRLLIDFRRSFQRKDIEKCKNTIRFIAHLVNQQVAHVVLAGQICGFLLETPTEDCVELCVDLILECGKSISLNAPKISFAVFESFRAILVSGKIEKRVQFMIERLFRVRQESFQGYPGVPPELDLVESDDQITHEVELDDDLDAQLECDSFEFDPEFQEHEERYNEIKMEILGDEEESTEEEDHEPKPYSSSTIPSPEAEKKPLDLHDMSNIEVQKFKRDVYLMFTSSLDHEECAFKIIKSGISENRSLELCSMIIEGCTEERAYNKFYGLLAERFCRLGRQFQEAFEELFKKHYESVDELEINKLRNISRFFAHLLESDVLSWSVMRFIEISEESLTAASRVFIKILFQEIIEGMGLSFLLNRMKDEYLVKYFEGLFPIDHPKRTKYAILFWKSSGLGELVRDLELYLEEIPKELLESDDSEDEDSEDEEKVKIKNENNV